jgi:hypothetical protein
LHSSDSRPSRRSITSRTLCGIRRRHEGSIATVSSPALVREQAHDLTDEERVSLRLVVHGGDEGRRRLDPSGKLDHAGDIALGQTADVQPACDAVAGELAYGRRERITLGHVHVTVGAREQDLRCGELASDEFEQEEGGRVGCVEVVEHDQQRLLGGGPSQKRGCGVEQAKARPLGVERRRRRHVAENLTHLGQDLRQLACPWPELSAQVLGSLLADVCPQRLHPWPVSRRAARLPTPAREHERAAVPRSRRELVGQPALADAGLAGNQEQPSPALKCIVQARKQLGELALPSNEDAAGTALPDERHPRPFLHTIIVPLPRDGARGVDQQLRPVEMAGRKLEGTG